MPMSESPSRPRRWLLALAAATCLSGCASIGAGSVNRDRMDYAEALGRSWKEQMLLNMVRLRYGDTPVFLEVSSVISSYQLQSQVNLTGIASSGLTSGLADTVGRGVNLGASGIYTDRPTITYTPLQGEKFTRSMLRPIAPAALFQLIQAGYPADVIVELAARAINGIYNRSDRAMGRRDADPLFPKVLKALRRLQVSEAVGFRLEKRGLDETSLITLRESNIPSEVEQYSSFLRSTLRLGADARELTLVYGAIARNDRELALLTRSALEILIELGARVDVPPADVQSGRAFPTAAPEPAAVDRPLVKVHSGGQPPADVFAAVPYRGHWFWIDDRDFRSKSVFSFMLLLTSLAETGGTPQVPVITVPAG